MISDEQLSVVLDSWGSEYGYGGSGRGGTTNTLVSIGDFGGGSGGGVRQRVASTTIADEFQASWLRYVNENNRNWRCGMCLRADVFAHHSDPMSLILERLSGLGIRMGQQEFSWHVAQSRAHFCRTFEPRATPLQSQDFAVRSARRVG